MRHKPASGCGSGRYRRSGRIGNLCTPDRSPRFRSTPTIAMPNPEIAMKSLTTLFSSLILSLALAGAALAGETVNINTANAATIDRVLVNVGPAKADAIVAYRKSNGAFRSPEQLALVKGIGLKTVEKNRDRIVVGGVRPAGKAAKPAAAAPKAVARR
jgi:competence protein ComEA